MMSPHVPSRSPALAPAPDSGKGPRLRPGVVLLTLLLIPPQAFWLIRVETQLGSFSTNNTDVSLFFTTVFALFAAGLLNRSLAHRRPGWALRPAEMAVLYTILTISAAFSGSDLMQNLTPVLVHPFEFGTPENGWADLFFRFIPPWFAPRDPAVVAAYYDGNATFYRWEHIRAWLTPMAVWGALLFVLGGMMLSINTLIYAQWAHRERLTFPVIQLPLEMVRPGGLEGLLSSRLFVGAALGTAVVELVNTVHSAVPGVPYTPLAIQNVGQYFTQPPWNALAEGPPLFVSWIPFAIGISFFLPLDLAFSAWAFFLVRRAEDVAAVYFGLRGPGASAGALRFPFIREQAAGAWIALFLLTLWTGRRYYAGILRAALGQERDASPEQVRAFRYALLGLSAGAVYLVAFSHLSGMAAWVAVLYFALYFALQVTMTRTRAQLGPPMLELYFVNPEQILVAFTGTRILSPQSLTVLSYYFWFNRCYRCQPMAHQLECLRIAETTGLSRQAVSGLVLAAMGLGIFFCAWAILHLYYDVGQGTAKILTYRTGVGREAFGRLEDWMRTPRGPDTQGIVWMGGAAAFTFGLAAMQSRFLWWPLHPIGYAFSVCYAMEYWWSTIALVWLFKLLLTRFGGMRAYTRARPFFLGLILGDAVTAVLVALTSWLFGWPGLSRY